MGKLAGRSGFVIVVLLAVVLMPVGFVPQVRQVWLQLRADEVTITQPNAHGGEGVQVDLGGRVDLLAVGLADRVLRLKRVTRVQVQDGSALLSKLLDVRPSPGQTAKP